MKKMICLLLAFLVTLPLCACSDTATTANNSSSNSSTESYYGTEDLIGGGQKPRVPTPEELMEPVTHIMFAMCAGVYMDDKDPEQVLFYFLPIKCVLGELEEVPLGTNLAYYGYEAILVKGDVADYQLDNVYGMGNVYELYLKEHKSDNEEVYYTDLLPYSEVLKFEEAHEFFYDESYVSELMVEMDDRTADIMKIIDRIENGRK